MSDALIHRLWRIIFKIFRRKRFAVFLNRIKPEPHERILDVGGYPATWEGNQGIAREIHIINIHAIAPPPDNPGNFRFQIADGCSLPFADQSFEILFSNSVIEHVGNFERQKAFASEARRVGRRLWIQTPAREFWIEPHYMTPFIHWLPRNLQSRLMRNFTVWGWLTRPSKKQIEETLDEIKLLRHAEMVQLFPDCEIHREKVCLGLFTKSYVAIRADIEEPTPRCESRSELESRL